MAGVVVVGAGPGIGVAVARRFAREGMPVAVVARSAETVKGAVEAVEGVPVAGFVADSVDVAALRAAFAGAGQRFGVPEVVVYNAAVIRADVVGQLTVREHQEAWGVNVVGAINVAAEMLPAMAARGSGSFIVTGGMPEGKAEYVSLSLGKAGVRALVGLLDEQFGAAGVHVATVTVAGAVAPGGDFDPEEIAEQYWRLHVQERSRWEREIVYRGREFDEGAAAVLGALLGDWRAAFDGHRTGEMGALFTADALFQGMDRRLRVGPREIGSYYDDVAVGARVTVEVIGARVAGDGVVGGFADATFVLPDGEVRPLRLSLVVRRTGDGWRIGQYHAAVRAGQGG
ncbi:SDR family NAD(P)-dependent oxidoreductase [Nocardia sp. alder85J]|uniref:SDR family NAD(P)-dependent oxidoreductase n=1 Tax=Nocardia sp. alder85J TaxID=2862949 RepID=UPI001CD28D94|nr:SDR family NAD(P)-dependent oxidoreductase [Nocardia sp. alder85J]MCX4099211.1 SDR family NAD(P)-dependent oxidoreductase [Nocardia sp. alder85J]